MCVCVLEGAAYGNVVVTVCTKAKPVDAMHAHPYLHMLTCSR